MTNFRAHAMIKRHDVSELVSASDIEWANSLHGMNQLTHKALEKAYRVLAAEYYALERQITVLKAKQ